MFNSFHQLQLWLRDTISLSESQNFKYLYRQCHFYPRTETRPFCFVFTVHNSILHSTVCVVILCICVDYGHDGLCVQTALCLHRWTDRNNPVTQSLGSCLFISAITICMTLFENRILKRIFGPEKGSNWRK